MFQWLNLHDRKLLQTVCFVNGDPCDKQQWNNEQIESHWTYLGVLSCRYTQSQIVAVFIQTELRITSVKHVEWSTHAHWPDRSDDHRLLNCDFKLPLWTCHDGSLSWDVICFGSCNLMSLSRLVSIMKDGCLKAPQPQIYCIPSEVHDRYSAVFSSRIRQHPEYRTMSIQINEDQL